jgi:predicted nucleic acid-binding protein
MRLTKSGEAQLALQEQSMQAGAENSLELHAAGGRLYARARWQRVAPRSPHDCLIAATAVDKRLPLLHDDRDFERAS